MKEDWANHGGQTSKQNSFMVSNSVPTSRLLSWVPALVSLSYGVLWDQPFLSQAACDLAVYHSNRLKLGQGRKILIHGFRGLSPWSFGPLHLGQISWQWKLVMDQRCLVHDRGWGPGTLKDSPQWPFSVRWSPHLLKFSNAPKTVPSAMDLVFRTWAFERHSLLVVIAQLRGSFIGKCASAKPYNKIKLQ